MSQKNSRKIRDSDVSSDDENRPSKILDSDVSSSGNESPTEEKPLQTKRSQRSRSRSRSPSPPPPVMRVKKRKASRPKFIERPSAIPSKKEQRFASKIPGHLFNVRSLDDSDELDGEEEDIYDELSKPLRHTIGCLRTSDLDSALSNSPNENHVAFDTDESTGSNCLSNSLKKNYYSSDNYKGDDELPRRGRNFFIEPFKRSHDRKKIKTKKRNVQERKSHKKKEEERIYERSIRHHQRISGGVLRGSRYKSREKDEEHSRHTPSGERKNLDDCDGYAADTRSSEQELDEEKFFNRPSRKGRSYRRKKQKKKIDGEKERRGSGEFKESVRRRQIQKNGYLVDEERSSSDFEKRDTARRKKRSGHSRKKRSHNDRNRSRSRSRSRERRKRSEDEGERGSGDREKKRSKWSEDEGERRSGDREKRSKWSEDEGERRSGDREKRSKWSEDEGEQRSADREKQNRRHREDERKQRKYDDDDGVVRSKRGSRSGRKKKKSRSSCDEEEDFDVKDIRRKNITEDENDEYDKKFRKKRKRNDSRRSSDRIHRAREGGSSSEVTERSDSGEDFILEMAPKENKKSEEKRRKIKRKKVGHRKEDEVVTVRQSVRINVADLSNDVVEEKKNIPGKGKLYFNKDRYEGEIKNGKMHGTGTYYYSNSDRFEGKFWMNEMHGRGMLFKENGEIFTLVYNNGKLCRETPWDDNFNFIKYRLKYSDIELGKMLGEGGFGAVYAGRWNGKGGGIEIAVKVIEIDDEFSYSYLAEFRLVMECNHPLVLQVYGYAVYKRTLKIVMERMDGDLENYIQKNKLKFFQKLNIMKKITMCLLYLHSNKILHRDVKTMNFLTKGSGDSLVLKVTDFGYAKMNEHINRYFKSDPKGTTSWMAPELLKHTDDVRYSVYSDVYALAITFAEIVNEDLPFQLEIDRKQLNPYDISSQVRRGRRPKLDKRKISNSNRKWMENLLERCWCQKAMERLTTEQVLEEIKEKEESLYTRK